VVLWWESSVLGCVVVGVCYREGGHLYWVVWLLVSFIVVGVICIWLCVCGCVLLWWESSVFGCVVFGVCYRGGVHL